MDTKDGVKQIQILVVDDDPDICDFMETLLQQVGYSVESLTNPSRALEELRTQRYHLVIVDLMLGKVDGLEMLRAIRNFDTDIAIVVLTGYPSVETAVESLKLSVSDYIRKPFDSDEFLDSIERIFREKGVLVDPEHRLHSTIGQNIRRRRKDLELTLKQLSRRTNLSVSLLSQIERAESSASVSSLYKVARALNCRLTNLFGDL